MISMLLLEARQVDYDGHTGFSPEAMLDETAAFSLSGIHSSSTNNFTQSLQQLLPTLVLRARTPRQCWLLLSPQTGLSTHCFLSLSGSFLASSSQTRHSALLFASVCSTRHNLPATSVPPHLPFLPPRSSVLFLLLHALHALP